MLLEGKTAVVYGGSGAIGGAAARAFAREGARVFLVGRTAERLQRTVSEISDAGGRADFDLLDVLDQPAVERHARTVVDRASAIDIALTAVGFAHVQGPPFSDLSLEDFERPIMTYSRANFITAKAVAPHMARRRKGVILTLSTPGSRMAGSGFLGYGTTCGAIETFSRILAGELGGQGIRVVCLRPDAIPEALPISHAREVFEGFARRFDTTVEAMLEARATTGTLLGRFPRLDEVADYAAFVASDRAGAMTGAIANLTCGSLVD
ncbi:MULTISPECIES: SDR family oxidoreductase [unclassified Ensifer]|uniref:SDR family NAD(P)-dependent oxidoreductase n=1 Tax=unclassified Ensifer TaxID=2633371 RepID=UPI000812E9BF|nr:MULTISPECIES: SDR family oxidoreductase [unclassified Ensifer]OCP09277.1 short-chain dehydrogenase [Ensifer sp. LC13]OCP10458.1 short-chain dehydrogenase [Ensifer sp. LC11]OCP13935.1 short-chain dehydrogenase [Ensifer sp. LC14]OCP32525.1 short-chain dehydrogenase [Ensifer sp. LC499]